MKHHPYFDLILHTDRELENNLGSRIVERQTLHEWPLSSVQMLLLADGRRKVYKTSSGPTVEAEFYAQARSSLLIHGETVYHDGRYTCMLFEYLDAPSLSGQKMNESEAFDFGQNLLSGIRRVEGVFPLYMDISSWGKWTALVAELVGTLRGLVSSKVFRIVTTRAISKIEQAASSGTVKMVIEGPAGLVHNDLTDDNIFLFKDGCRVIDWQRPIRGPLGLDLVTLAEVLGFDPIQWAGQGNTVIREVLLIHWFTECAVRWFSAGAETYDQQIAGICERFP